MASVEASRSSSRRAARRSASIGYNGTVRWLVCEFERLKVDDTADEVRWTYDLTLRNKGKQSAELIHGFATVVLGSVRRSPDQVIGRRAIAPGETYRVPHTVIVRRAELADPQALMVKWQILGRYQDGYPIIAEVEVR